MVSYAEEAILINMFGDEWGGGELWDLYQAIENRKKFFKIFVYIISGIFFVVGGSLMLIYFFDSGSKYLLLTGIIFIFVAIIALVAHHFFVNHKFLNH